MISDPFELMEYSWSLLTFTSTVGEINISRTISLYVIALDLCRWVRHNELPLPHEQPHTTSDIFDFRLPKISDLFLHIHTLSACSMPRLGCECFCVRSRIQFAYNLNCGGLNPVSLELDRQSYGSWSIGF